MPAYLPFEQRRISTSYRDMLQAIRDTGTRVSDEAGRRRARARGVPDALRDGARRGRDHGALDRRLRAEATVSFARSSTARAPWSSSPSSAATGGDRGRPLEKCASRGLPTGDLGPGS